MSDADPVVLAVSDPTELSSLVEWLRRAGPARAERTAGAPGPGELGAHDVLTLLGGSAALVAAVKILPEFLRARRSGLTVTVKARDRTVTVDATNVDNVLPVLERVLEEHDAG
jgi:hypothetical protein